MNILCSDNLNQVGKVTLAFVGDVTAIISNPFRFNYFQFVIHVITNVAEAHKT